MYLAIKLMLKHLELINFRNWSKYSIGLARTTIIVGPNGAGKTNLIEAINLLSTGRSWRTSRDGETIKWGSDFAKIIAKIHPKGELEMVIQKLVTPDRPQQKMIKINSVKKKLSEVLGFLPTVLFSPEEIFLVEGPPALRRRFIDILLCQIDKKYTLALLDLAKIIQGRNKLLYYLKIGQAKIKEIEFWDEKLVILGSFIIARREQAIAKLNEDLSQIYQEISQQEEDLQIKYKKTVAGDNFLQVLIENRQREIENTATLFGPHRDDLVFLLTNKNLATFGSRGEYRSAVLALKVAEQKYLTQEKNQPPILLLDDIFSELDSNRRLHLKKIINAGQTVITTADPGQIEADLKKEAKIVELKS